ncbi:MAG: DUF1559 domain-containing protein, partial [Planctomycetales bacterium]|nr:DUF1559 domain-containing protein [Planctomycetales bacterium]
SSMWQGHDYDNVRWPSGSYSNTNQPQGNLPASDSDPSIRYKVNGYLLFGSAHSSGINSVYADGSVHQVSFDVDPLVWNALGDRDDGESYELP